MGAKPINFNFDMKQKFMFVETNIIKDVPVGNGNGKILKILPLSVKTDNLYVTQDLEKLEFHPLSHHRIQNINFKLLSQSGSSMEAHENGGYNITWLQLTFRKFPKNNNNEPKAKSKFTPTWKLWS